MTGGWAPPPKLWEHVYFMLTNAQTSIASVVLDGVLGTPDLGRHTWLCLCASVVLEAMHEASRGLFKGRDRDKGFAGRNRRVVFPRRLDFNQKKISERNSLLFLRIFYRRQCKIVPQQPQKNTVFQHIQTAWGDQFRILSQPRLRLLAVLCLIVEVS